MNQFRPKSGKVYADTPSRTKENWLTSSANWMTVHLKLERKLTASALSKIIWVGGLALVYIYFQHNFDSLIRKTEKAEKALELQKAMFVSHKASYLYASKQSEIEKKLENRGFTNRQSPIKISTQTAP